MNIWITLKQLNIRSRSNKVLFHSLAAEEQRKQGFQCILLDLVSALRMIAWIGSELASK